MPQENNDDSLLKIIQNGSYQFLKADTLAASALREAIIKGALIPGQEIDEEMVARSLNLSRTPVRQALGVLEAEGLVKRQYRKGAIVTELTSAELEELYHMRACLEGLAIRRAVPNYDDKHIGRVEACFEQFQASAHDATTYFELNNRFHSLLYEPCEWDRLLALITQLRNNTGRYMILAHEVIVRNPPAGLAHEHILDACRRRDALGAEQIIQNHILNAMKVLLRMLEQSEL